MMSPQHLQYSHMVNHFFLGGRHMRHLWCRRSSWGTAYWSIALGRADVRIPVRYLDMYGRLAICQLRDSSYAMTPMTHPCNCSWCFIQIVLFSTPRSRSFSRHGQKHLQCAYRNGIWLFGHSSEWQLARFW